MRILFIAHRIPYPPNKGEKIRAFHQIRHLAKRHQVHLACLVDAREDWQHVETLKQYCQSVDAVFQSPVRSRFRSLLGLFGHQPLSVVAFYSAQLQHLIRSRIKVEQFDCIVVFSSAMAEYVRGYSNLSKLIDFVDVDSEKWRTFAGYHAFPLSWIYRLEGRRLADYEESAAEDCACVAVVSEQEADLLRRRVPGRRVAVVPNGVDLEYFKPSIEAASTKHSPVIVFTGVMDYFPNVDAVTYFCREVFPLVRNSVPAATFLIVGRGGGREVKTLGDLPNVTVTGAVEDVRPYLAKAAVAVAPFRIARGVQNKILEAMAMGVPVVGTPLAFQAMQCGDVEFMRPAANPIHFAEEILSFLRDEELHRRSSMKARAFVERNYRWEDHNNQLESILLELGREIPPSLGVSQ